MHESHAFVGIDTGEFIVIAIPHCPT